MRAKVSIIIPAYNEERYIGRLLNSLCSQSFKNFEVIVVDDGSTDNTMRIAESFRNNLKLKILQQNHKGPGEARNFGAENANGELLVLLDADMVCGRNSIRDLVLPLLKDKLLVGTVHNLEKTANMNNIWARCAGKIRKLNLGVEENAFRAVRRSKFISAGGFDSREGYRDDATLIPKIGNPRLINAVLYHNNPESLNELFKQEKWIGNSCQINSPFFIKTIILPAIILILLTGILSIMGFALQFILLAFFVGFIGIILLLSFIKASKEQSFDILPFLPVFYLTKISGRLTGILKKIIKSNTPR